MKGDIAELLAATGERAVGQERMRILKDLRAWADKWKDVLFTEQARAMMPELTEIIAPKRKT